ncbi:MAG: aldo/keto reductase [Chloroflexi bacterium]|nr:aldo/keto reductase [Chloroflexota bacterium]
MRRSNNQVSKLALGTVQFGLPYGVANQKGQVSSSVAKSMLKLAAENGVDTLDTAIAYGESESRLGDVGTQGFKLVTKLPAIPDTCSDIHAWINEQISSSLVKLGVGSVYGLLLHRSEQLLGTYGEEIYQALDGLKKTELVEKIGISIYSPSELDALIPRYRLDLVQAPFNLIDRRLYLSGWMQKLKQDEVEIHTRSAFLQGLLLMPRSAIPAKFAPWKALWDKWHEWLSCHSVTAVKGSLSYPLSFPEIDRVVVGADSKRQLEEIIDAACGVVPDDLPDLSCEDVNLINPASWPTL